MGNKFGKELGPEAKYDIILKRDQNVHTAYEVRKYCKCFAVTCKYDDTNNMEAPFLALSGYIGALGEPRNEGQDGINLTNPIVFDGGVSKGENIEMTGPFVTETKEDGTKIMKFMLPEAYDEISKIPKPVSPAVGIEELPPQAGVIHRYNGSIDKEHNDKKAKKLAQQLKEDGLDEISEDYMLSHYQFWAYNPPSTISFFRRNEVWLQLDQDQVQKLVKREMK
eukprot:scaffold821_cov122-Cylindrotheca_fusiformis.AAC.7